MSKKITTTLTYNYPTEKHVRFDEDDGDKVVGSLYLKTKTWDELGQPDEIKLTIEGNDS